MCKQVAQFFVASITLILFGCGPNSNPSHSSVSGGAEPKTTSQIMAYLDTTTNSPAIDARYEDILERLSRKYPESKTAIGNMTKKAQELLLEQHSVSRSLYEIMMMADEVDESSRGTLRLRYAEVMALYVTLGGK